MTATSPRSDSCSLDCKRFGGEDELLLPPSSSSSAEHRCHRVNCTGRRIGKMSDRQEDGPEAHIDARANTDHRGRGEHGRGQGRCIGEGAFLCLVVAFLPALQYSNKNKAQGGGSTAH